MNVQSLPVIVENAYLTDGYATVQLTVQMVQTKVLSVGKKEMAQMHACLKMDGFHAKMV